jgi:hypothetical protein
MRIKSVLLPAVCLSFLCCQNPLAPSVPIGNLLEAPEQIEIEGRVYALETYLWRDFMPPAEPGGSDLRAVLLITATDLLPFPDDVDSDRLWIIRGEDFWETGYSGENRPRDGSHLHQLEKWANGGPKWETGIEVQVVVRILSSRGDTYLLRAASQLINRTE